MKVISGKYKGLILPIHDSTITRPTQPRVKESLFGMIQNNIKDAVVLDLFAGTGALGIEALSNYAKEVYFNEFNKSAYKLLKDWLSDKENSHISNLDYLTFLKSINQKYDIIFIDPPYKFDYGIKAIEYIMENNILNKDGVIVLETDKEIDLTNYNIIKTRKYGSKKIYIIS